MADFPPSLPIAVQDGYTLEPVNPVIRTEMEGGPQRQRRRFTQASTFYNIKWIFTLDEFATFEKWHKEDIYDGASWFNNLELLNGQGVTNQTARFIEMWKASPRSGKGMIVSAKIETRTRPLNA